MIFTGVTHFSPARAFTFPAGALTLTPEFFTGLGAALLIAVYDYWGYYNVCYLGGEIRDPGRVIPRAILLSIAGVAALYLTMNIAILGAMPWQDVERSRFIASDFMARFWGPGVGAVVTVLMLWTAFASVFSLLLGYSRVPYAAALEGDYFKVFAKVHPRHHFPHVSLLWLGGTAAVFCLFKLADVVTALVVIRISVQFLAQTIGIMVLRRRRPDMPRPFRMWLYPLPAVLAFLGFVYRDRHAAEVARVDPDRGAGGDRRDRAVPGPAPILTPARMTCGSAHGLDDGVVERRTDGADPVVVARRVDAVGEQHDIQIALPVDPERCAAEAGVTDRRRRQPRAAGRRRQHRVPSKCARTAGDGCAPRHELAQRRGLGQNAIARKRGQQRARERSDCGGGAEQAGVAGRATESPGILVVHLADEDSPPPGIELRRCDARPQCPRRVEQQRLRRDERRHFPELRRQRRRRFEPPAGAAGVRASCRMNPSRMNPRSL